MSKPVNVQLVYLTPVLEGEEGVNPANEFEDLDDLTARASLESIEVTLNKAVIYYEYFLDARESGRVLIARPYNKNNCYPITDEIDCDMREVDRFDMEVEGSVLQKTVKRAGLDNIDELFKRALIVFEKVVIAHENGWGIAIYDQAKKDCEWLVDSEIASKPSRHGPGKPVLQ